MMAYRHGVRSEEAKNSLIAPVETDAGLPVVIGVAPVNLAVDPYINRPALCFDMKDAQRKFGFSQDFEKYSISEFMSSHFSLFEVGPAVFINVLDPTKHKKAGTEQTLAVSKGEAVLKKEGVIPGSLKVTSADGLETYDAFETEFDDNGFLHIFTDAALEIKVTFDVVDPSMVTSADIIGGVSPDGSSKGLELINRVFPLFRKVPGLIVAPGHSTDPAVAAVMAAKSSNINGLFVADCLVDVSTVAVKDYSEVAAYKNENGLTSNHQFVCWPKVSLGGKQYHLSTQLAGVINTTDAAHEDVPYKSPSNENLKADSAVLADGTEVSLGPDQAAYLNGEGIVTALNFIGGWRLWGNRTGAFPSIATPEDSFIPVRRMMNYLENSLILTYWSKVDDPTNKKLIETVLDSENIRLNGMTAKGYLLGGRIEFNASENPLADLQDGKVKFHIFFASPSPARDINFLVEYDASYLGTLFA